MKLLSRSSDAPATVDVDRSGYAGSAHRRVWAEVLLCGRSELVVRA